jgi:hypothetical protein
MAEFLELSYSDVYKRFFGSAPLSSAVRMRSSIEKDYSSESLVRIRLFAGRLVGINGEMELVEQSAPLSPVSSTMSGDAAYSVYVLSRENEPVYRIGDAVILNPVQPAAPGDDALFRRQDEDGNLGNALLRHLVDFDDKNWLTLHYSEPDKKEKLSREEYLLAHRVDAVKRK